MYLKRVQLCVAESTVCLMWFTYIVWNRHDRRPIIEVERDIFANVLPSRTLEIIFVDC
jgi:hypothetical protein